MVTEYNLKFILTTTKPNVHLKTFTWYKSGIDNYACTLRMFIVYAGTFVDLRIFIGLMGQVHDCWGFNLKY